MYQRSSVPGMGVIGVSYAGSQRFKPRFPPTPGSMFDERWRRKAAQAQADEAIKDDIFRCSPINNRFEA